MPTPTEPPATPNRQSGGVLTRRYGLDGQQRPEPLGRPPFHEVIVGLLHRAVPTFDLTTLTNEIEAFLRLMFVSNEEGLSALMETDFPEPTPGTIWMVPPLRCNLSLLVSASTSYYLEPTTPIAVLRNAVHRTILSSPITQSTTSDITAMATDDMSSVTNDGSSKPQYAVRYVQDTTVDPFSGQFGTFKKWKEGVEMAFGKSGYQQFLTDEKLCEEYGEVSYSMKCCIAEALTGGAASYIAQSNKLERNVAKFYAIIMSTFDEKADKKVREFQQWMKLFTTSLTSIDDCSSYINTYEVCCSILKEHNSIGVTDEALLRALLLRAIDCPELSQLKLDITKDLEMMPAQIVEHIRSHSLAMNTENARMKTKGNGDTTAMKIRRGSMNKSKSNFQLRSGFPQENGNTKVPKFPPGLCEAVGADIWKQLTTWKMLFNKPNPSEAEKEKLRQFTIRPTERKRERDYESDSDGSSYHSKHHRHNRDRSYDHSDHRYNRGSHSGRTNRHTTDRYRSRHSEKKQGGHEKYRDYSDDDSRSQRSRSHDSRENDSYSRTSRRSSRQNVAFAAPSRSESPSNNNTVFLNKGAKR